MDIWTGVRKFAILVAAAAFFVVLANMLATTGADVAPSWLATTPILQKEGDLATGLSIPNASNRDCVDHKFITRPSRIAQTEVSHTACGVQTLYGIVDSNGWLELNGTRTSGKLINYGGYSVGSIPILNSTTLINYTSAPGGLYLHFTKNLPSAMTATNFNNGEVEYKINRLADASLRDKSNTILPTQTDSLSFSGGSQWIVVDSPNRAVLRVNIQTLEALPFAPTFNYNIGLNPGLQTAITSDGRYAVVYSKNFEVFKIYDLNTCGTVPNSITGPVACQSRDLLPLVQQQLPGLQSVSRIRFINNDTLSFYANYYTSPGVPSTNKIGKFRLSTSGNPTSQLELLALGESYISGEGVFEYKAGTDIPDNRCHLSVLSYPMLVAQELYLNSFNSIACSGAKIPDILDGSNQYRGQSDGIKRSQRSRDFIDGALRDFEPGYINQLSFITDRQPEKVLVSIGGNDIGFSKILIRCLEPDTCYSTYEDRVELVRQINGQFPKIVETYQRIKQETVPNAKVYAVGYPQIVFPGGDCDLNVRLNAQELEFARSITAYLDDVINRAASRAGVGFVDTQSALDGYRLCETKSSDIAVNGLTAGDNTPSFLRGPIGNESYHPNKFGHQLLSQSVLSGTQDLTKAMPLALPGSSPPTEPGLEILNAPKSNRPINSTNYDDDLANDVIYRETWWDITLDSLKYSLKSLSPLTILLNSEPVNLGTFTTSSSGGLSAQINIPATVPTGFHTLHVYGTNLAGEPIDIYKTVYLAASENDLDGDGIANTADPCMAIEPAGVDYDKDEVDDACDGFIGDPPPVVISSAQTSVPPADSNPAQPTQNPPQTGAVAKPSVLAVQSTGPPETLQANNGIEPASVVLPQSAPPGPADDTEVSFARFDFADFNRLGLIAISLVAGVGVIMLRRVLNNIS